METNNSKTAAEELAPYIYLPVPTLKDLPNPSAGRDERLRTIIANLDKQHQIVRNNIISAAKARLQERQQQQQQLATATATTIKQPDPDAMDIDPTTSLSTPSSGEILPSQHQEEEEQDPAIAHAEHLQSSLATTLLLHNLNASYPDDGPDPCIPPDGTLPPPPPEIRQATPPLEIQVAREALRQVEMYDAIAGEAREYYVRALRRGSVSAGVGGGGRGLMAGYGSGGYGSGGYGAGSAGGGGGGYGQPGVSPANHRANASPVDFLRDPRRKGR